MHRLKLSVGPVSMEMELVDSELAARLVEALPVESRANRWGDEIYFEVPVSADEAPDARQEMEVGEVAFWPPGSALCVFFGPTPVSRGKEPRAYSPVNPLGKVLGDPGELRKVKDGDRVLVERA